MQSTRYNIVLVIPETEIFLRLARYAREVALPSDLKIIIAAQKTLSLWQHFNRRKKRAGIVKSSLEVIYCLLEGYISPWIVAAERLALKTAVRPDVMLARETFSRDLAEACSRHDADILIAMGCEIIDLSFFPLGFKAVNIHPGILPAYRGVGNPEALLKSDFENLGFSVHQMTMDVDQGASVAQARCPEIKKMSIPEGYLYCYLQALELLTANGGSLLKAPINKSRGSIPHSSNKGRSVKNVWHLTLIDFLLIKLNVLMH